MPKPQGDVQLAIGYWIVSHKDRLKTWWAISLLIFIAASLLWSLAFFGQFFGTQGRTDQLVAQAASGINSFIRGASLTPSAVTTTSVTLIRRDEKHVDLVGWMRNPNRDWAAQSLRAHFVIDGAAQPTQDLFLNQASESPVIDLNVLAPTTATASLVIDEVNWARANAAALPAASFSVDNVVVTPTTVKTSNQTVSTVSLTASITNRSVYNFYRVVVPVVLKSADTPVAVDLLSFNTWPTLTSKPLTVTWSYPISGATTADIVPQINQYDTSNVYR